MQYTRDVKKSHLIGVFDEETFKRNECFSIRILLISALIVLVKTDSTLEIDLNGLIE